MKYRRLTEKEKLDDLIAIRHFENKYGYRFNDPVYECVPFASQHVTGIFGKILRQQERILIGTYFIDVNTNDHQEIRKQDRVYSPAEYKWYKRHNKLGINMWGNIPMFLDIANILTEGGEAEKHSIPTNEEYDIMSRDDKINLVCKMESKVFSCLEHICKLNSQQPISKKYFW